MLAFTDLRGGREVLGRARELVRADDVEAARALMDLAAVWDLLEGFGLAGRLAIDLGLVKDLTYYTGLVMEGYVPRLGYTLCTGGRYDGLYAQFGADEPATGFALGLERVAEALARQTAAGGGAREADGGLVAPPAPGEAAWVRERLAGSAGKGR